MRRSAWYALVLLTILGTSASAQKKVKEPKRPTLGADADTNDAGGYYRWGVAQLEWYPEDAADAFYWAIRLDPTSADAYYARWAALHLSDPNRLVLYYLDRNEKIIRSAEVRQIDSLRLHAMQMNPYLYRKFERIMRQHALQRWVEQNNPGVDQAELADDIREYTSKGGPYTKGINAYIAGNFPFALEEYATAMPGWKYKFYLHAERGRIFYMLGAYDSAAAEFNRAVGELRNYDKDELTFVYESKALYEQSLAMIDEKRGRVDSARESYGRALQEDLSYAPAHLGLSAIDLAKSDTAGALSEMEIAAQVQPNDGVIAYIYGRTLLLSAHDAQAVEQLKRAVVLEPYFAEPRILLAAVYDNADYTAEAIEAYTAFLNLASKRDTRLALAQKRLVVLSAAAAAPAPTKP